MTISAPWLDRVDSRGGVNLGEVYAAAEHGRSDAQNPERDAAAKPYFENNPRSLGAHTGA